MNAPATQVQTKKPIPQPVKRQAIVRYFDKKRPFATIAGDSPAKYEQNGYFFDLEGFVVHPYHASRAVADVSDAHEQHKDEQKAARAAAHTKTSVASSKLAALTEPDATEVEPENPEAADEITEESVCSEYAHRPDDIKNLRALDNKAINKACKKAGLEFNPSNGKPAKWENINALLEATEPGPTAEV
jgi:hypothetical protein